MQPDYFQALERFPHCTMVGSGEEGTERLDVGEFQGYEQTHTGQHLIRAFRKGTAAIPGALATRLEQSGQAGTYFLLNESLFCSAKKETTSLDTGEMHKYQHPNLLNDEEECMPLVTAPLLQLSSFSC